jgi:catechol 2,3-dioxygenase-like lactoylglutathione lyase family enzyme
MRPGMRRPELFLVVGLVLEWFVGIAGPLAQPPQPPVVEAVEAVGTTVADMERSVGFYSTVLAFEKVSDVEVTGSAYERLQGVFLLRDAARSIFGSGERSGTQQWSSQEGPRNIGRFWKGASALMPGRAGRKGSGPRAAARRTGKPGSSLGRERCDGKRRLSW